jgi:hypothetical protein
MLRLAALVAFVALVPAPAGAQGGVDPATAAIVERLQGLAGMVRGDALRFTRVRGEGRTIVIELEILPSAPDMVQSPMVPGPIVASLCAEPAAPQLLFADGRTLRLEVSRSGRTTSFAYESCPAHAGEGITAAVVANSMQGLIGMPIEDGITIGAVRAQGETVVLTFDAPGPVRDGPGIALAFVLGFCQRPESQPQFFDIGLSMRIDIVPMGTAPAPGRLFTTCPGR